MKIRCMKLARCSGLGKGGIPEKINVVRDLIQAGDVYELNLAKSLNNSPANQVGIFQQTLLKD